MVLPSMKGLIIKKDTCVCVCVCMYVCMHVRVCIFAGRQF